MKRKKDDILTHVEKDTEFENYLDIIIKTDIASKIVIEKNNFEYTGREYNIGNIKIIYINQEYIGKYIPLPYINQIYVGYYVLDNNELVYPIYLPINKETTWYQTIIKQANDIVKQNNNKNEDNLLCRKK